MRDKIISDGNFPIISFRRGDFMAKKNKIRRLTEDQYFAYVAGLKENAALFDKDGNMIVPEAFDNTDGD